jgi:hypothetical protein
MHYVDESGTSGPSGPSPDPGGWATFISGDLVRCPACHRGVAGVRGAVVIRVRVERADALCVGLRYRCVKCGVYLEIRFMSLDQEQAA